MAPKTPKRYETSQAFHLAPCPPILENESFQKLRRHKELLFLLNVKMSRDCLLVLSEPISAWDLLLVESD